MFKVPVLQVGISEFSIGGNKKKQIFFMNVDEQLAECELLYPDCDKAFNFLSECVLIKSLVAFEQLAADFKVDHIEILIFLLPLILLSVEVFLVLFG